jgi:hypothetical protein
MSSRAQPLALATARGTARGLGFQRAAGGRQVQQHAALVGRVAHALQQALPLPAA